MNIQDGNGQAEENLPGQETEEEFRPGMALIMMRSPKQNRRTRYRKRLTEKKTGKAQRRKRERTRKRSLSKIRMRETEENPNTEPGTGENTEIPEEETADFVLTAEVNPETARAGETLVCEIATENTGTLPLENLSFFCEQPDSTLTAVLEDQQGEETPWENTGMLLPGEKQIFYICIPVPEDRTEEVGFELTAKAYPQNTEKEDHNCWGLFIRGSSADSAG